MFIALMISACWCSAISGHKTLIMVERYAQQSGAHISAAMDKLGARYQIAKKSA